MDDGSEERSAAEVGEHGRRVERSICLHRAPPRGGTQEMLGCRQGARLRLALKPTRTRKMSAAIGCGDPLMLFEQRDGSCGNEARELT